ncbi:MAG: hypothetical protein ABI401_14815 [Candidatus Dormibacter sp.]
MTHTRSLGALAIGIPLLLAACGSQATAPASSPSPSMSMMPEASGNMTAKFVSPQTGAVVTTNSLDVKVAVTGYQLSCALAGKPPKEGIGHYHIELDHALVNMYCTDSASISMRNVSAGQHTLTVLPALNNHEEVTKGKEDMTFTYQPASALPAITAASLGTPSITILSPHNGDTVSGNFTVQVAINNFNPSCDLFGKANLKGYGHWHINVDSMNGPMMGMGTMLGMSCAVTFQASTQALTSGQHSFFALLVDNQHAPLMPDVADKVDLIVK